ncbi:hypothetical protein L208DRAFT_330606 [Tricholoma matsutake]|nr:hypothetical protein L208DRAFT_330606 [Tricholoma matsutake 945]
MQNAGAAWWGCIVACYPGHAWAPLLSSLAAVPFLAVLVVVPFIVVLVLWVVFVGHPWCLCPPFVVPVPVVPLGCCGGAGGLVLLTLTVFCHCRHLHPRTSLHPVKPLAVAVVVGHPCCPVPILVLVLIHIPSPSPSLSLHHPHPNGSLIPPHKQLLAAADWGAVVVVAIWFVIEHPQFTLRAGAHMVVAGAGCAGPVISIINLKKLLKIKKTRKEKTYLLLGRHPLSAS